MDDKQAQATAPPPPYSSVYNPNPNYGAAPGMSAGYPGYTSPVHPTPTIYTQPTVVTQQMGLTGAPTIVNDHFTLAVFATVCCFWPTGIFAIMRASESRSALVRGDVHAAIVASNDSRRFSLISIGIGIFCIITIVVVVTVLLTVGFNYDYYYED